MKKSLLLILTITVLSLALLVGCAPVEDEGTNPDQEAELVMPETDVDKQMISRAELKYIITSMQSDYVVLDLRKAEDVANGTIITAIAADTSASVENEDHEAAAANIKAALTTATGDELGADKKIVLICYTGNKYAQNATNILVGLGVDNARIFTLEGGFNGWVEDDADGEYQRLVDLAAQAEDNLFAASMFEAERPGDLYMTPEQVKALIDDGSIADYYFVDARYISDYEAGHIVGSIQVATFASAEGAVFVPYAEAKANVEAAFAAYPYTEGQSIIIVCKGGRGGAQLLDDVLRAEFGIANDLIYTMSYGFQAFDESWINLGDDYMAYVVTGAEPGSVE